MFGVGDTTHKNPKNLSCLTCDIGSDCLYNDVTFSPGFTYYVLECLGPGIPRIELRLTETNEIGMLNYFSLFVNYIQIIAITPCFCFI